MALLITHTALIKDIANTHNRPTYKINELINNNLKSVILSKDKEKIWL